MRNKRFVRRNKGRVLQAIENHISQNRKEYLIAVIVFIVGIIIGVMMVNTSTQNNKEDITGYINGFVESIKNKEFKIDGKKLFIKSVWNNIKIAIIVWVAGLTIIGIPVIYLSVGYKGLCIGYSISSIMATVGKTKGLVFAITTMLVQNIIAIPCILALMVSSLKMYKSTMKCRNISNIKQEVYRHTMFSIIMTIGLIISSVIEFLLTTTILDDVIQNFM